MQKHVKTILMEQMQTNADRNKRKLEKTKLKDAKSKETIPEKNSQTPDSTGRYVTMLNKLGQKYHCSLPLVGGDSNLGSDGSSLPENTDQQSNEGKRKVTHLLKYQLFR